MKRDAFLVAKIDTINDVKTVRSYIHPQTYCKVYVHYYTQSLLYAVSTTYFTWLGDYLNTCLYYNID